MVLAQLLGVAGFSLLIRFSKQGCMHRVIAIPHEEFVPSRERAATFDCMFGCWSLPGGVVVCLLSPPPPPSCKVHASRHIRTAPSAAYFYIAACCLARFLPRHSFCRLGLLTVCTAGGVCPSEHLLPSLNSQFACKQKTRNMKRIGDGCARKEVGRKAALRPPSHFVHPHQTGCSAFVIFSIIFMLYTFKLLP